MKHPAHPEKVPAMLESIDKFIAELTEIKTDLNTTGLISPFAVAMTIHKEEGIQTLGLSEADRETAVLHFLDQMRSVSDPARRAELLEILVTNEITGEYPDFMQPNDDCNCPACTERRETKDDEELVVVEGTGTVQ